MAGTGSKSTGRLAVALLLALAVALPASATAQENDGSGEVGAEAVLDAAEASLAGAGSEVDAVTALADVAQVLPSLEGAQRRRGERLLARPTQGASDPDGEGYNRPARSISTAHFCVFWVESGIDAPALTDTDGDGVPNYVEAAGIFAEKSYATEHGPLGFRAPVPDGNRGCNGGDGRSRTDLYIKDLDDLYGVAPVDAGQNGLRRYGYFLVDDDMVEVGYASNPLQALAVTIAHEYNHVVQFAYDYTQDDWMFESTSTWCEEKVFPAVNDYLGYIGTFARETDLPLTHGEGLHQYGGAVWNLYLSKLFGNKVVSRSWAASLRTTPKEFAPGAYSVGIPGAKGFSDQFVGFAATLPEWRSGNFYPDSNRYPEVRRIGSLSYAERFFDRFRLDHAAFRLLNVVARSGRAARLIVVAPDNVTSGLALVGRRANGTVVTRQRFLRNGGRGSVSLPSPGSFERITAVVVNADIDQRGYGDGDWDWTSDRRIYDAAILRVN